MPKADLARRHAKEKVDKDLETVLELEVRLDIMEHWTTTTPKWVVTTTEIKKRKYQLALDALELLIVERIFELTKMNQSQTGKSLKLNIWRGLTLLVGYKMRKHIAKALQARSKAVRSAIERYNVAASVLEPPMPALTWEQVVEYAFLADFDILRDTRAEVQSRPWTRPAYRLAMDRYFKTLRAREEIKRLNVEIPRVVTWIADENRFLRRMERGLRETEGKTEDEIERDIGMAVQVRLYRQRRGRFDDGHMRRFWALAKTPGFTASLIPGVSLERRAAERTLRDARRAARADEMEVDDMVVVDAAVGGWRQEEDEEWEDTGDNDEEVEGHSARAASAEDSDEESEGDEAKERAVSGLMYRISILAVDGEDGGSGDEA